MKAQSDPLPILGWREWLGLPDLGIIRTKAKIDTGARSSTLHALDIEIFEQLHPPIVRFRTYADSRDLGSLVSAEANLLETRQVRSSSGQAEIRPIILTQIALGNRYWSIELTLTNRTRMRFPMLLGRQAIRGHFLVDPGRSFLQTASRPYRFKSSNLPNS